MISIGLGSGNARTASRENAGPGMIDHSMRLAQSGQVSPKAGTANMRICMVCPTYPPNDVPCGVGDYTRELVGHLTRPGLSFTVVASTSHHPDRGASIRVVPFTARWDLRASLRLARFLHDEAFDLVHIQYTPELYGRSPGMKVLPALLALRGGPRVILTPHTLVGGYQSATMLAPLLTSFSHRIICPNEEVTYLVARYLRFLRQRVRQIPIGSNIPALVGDPEVTRAGIRAEFGLGADTMLLTHFGFAYSGKGLETLLVAAGHLRDAGTPFRLLMIGAPWPGAEAYYEELQARSRASGLKDHILWLGQCGRERIAALLSASDMYVVPYDDGISSRRGTLVSGIIHHLPIISTHPVRPSRLFRDGDNVLLVPPRDHAALARAMTTLITSPELRKRLRLGIAELANGFSWSRIADSTALVYHEVCG
jgi:glycosyltransferase involved in cell wall biosynthesis